MAALPEGHLAPTGEHDTKEQVPEDVIECVMSVRSKECVMVAAAKTVWCVGEAGKQWWADVDDGDDELWELVCAALSGVTRGGLAAWLSPTQDDWASVMLHLSWTNALAMRKSRSLSLSLSTTTITPLLALLRTHCLRHAHRSTLVSGLLQVSQQLASSIADKEQQILTQAKEYSACLIEKDDVINQLKIQVHSLSEKISGQAQEIEQNESHIKELSEQKKQLEEEIEMQKKTIEEQSKRIVNNLAEIERLRTDVQELEEKMAMQVSQSEAQIDEQRHALLEIEEKVGQLELERAELDQELVEMTPLKIATKMDGTLMKSDHWVYAVAIANGEDWLVAGTNNGVGKWSVANGNRLWKTKCGIITAICITTDDELIVGGYEAIVVWSAGDGSKLFVRKGAHEYLITSLSLSADDKFLASGSIDNKIKVWSMRDLKLLVNIGGHSDWVRGVQWTNPTRLVSGSRDKTVKVWQLWCRRGKWTAKQVSKIDVGCKVFCLVLSSSRTVVAVGSCVASSGGILSRFSSKTSIFVYNLADASQTAALAGHSDSVQSLAFHPHGENILVSGSKDKSIRIWNVAEKCCLRVIERH